MKISFRSKRVAAGRNEMDEDFLDIKIDQALISRPRGRRGPNEIDAALGGRIKTLRLLRGLSQTVLGERIGVTCQQVQKYERGINRLSVATALKISEALFVPLSVILEEIDLQNSDVESPGYRTFSDSGGMISIAEIVAIIKAYGNIRDENVRKHLLSTISSIEKSGV